MHSAPEVQPIDWRPVFVIHTHEAFAGVARRWSAAGVRATVAADQKPEIARVQSAHACGACQLRTA